MAPVSSYLKFSLLGFLSYSWNLQDSILSKKNVMFVTSKTAFVQEVFQP